MKNDSPVSWVSVKLMKVQRTNLTNLEPTIGTKFSRIAYYPNSVFNEMWFLTIDPFVGITVFIAKLSKRQYCWRVFEDFHRQEYIHSLTYTIASSCVCTSPLAVMTIGGLHDFVKVSISALLKSFWLIMCIDAPESTTNSRPSGVRVDAGRHLFSEGEKNVALSCSFNFNTSTLLRGAPLLLPLCLLLRPILKIWSVGTTLIRFTWAKKSERRILVSNFRVTRNSLCEIHTLDWFLRMSVLFRRIDFGGVMS